MAVRHQLIERPPQDVWAVLSDPEIYGDWVAGTSESRPGEGRWPRVGSSLEYTVGFGRLPWSLSGVTTVRREDEPHGLELEIDSGPLGTARVALDIRPWGEACSLVILDEHPLRGAGGTLHNAALDAVMQLRHRRMLARLAEVVEGSARPEASGDGAEPGSDAEPASEAQPSGDGGPSGPGRKRSPARKQAAAGRKPSHPATADGEAPQAEEGGPGPKAAPASDRPKPAPRRKAAERKPADGGDASDGAKPPEGKPSGAKSAEAKPAQGTPADGKAKSGRKAPATRRKNPAGGDGDGA